MRHRRGSVTVHGIKGSAVSTKTIKRCIAAAGALAAVATLAGLLLLISYAVKETGAGADPDRAFSSTQLDSDALLAEIAWLPDAGDLVRAIEPSTRDQIGVAWLRADDALDRAALGDLSGLEVWFVDAARANAEARFEVAPTVAFDVMTAPAVAHQLRVDFYSLDGQVVVLSVDTIRERPLVGSVPSSTVDVFERLEAMLVLSDGNWRVRHLERQTETNLSIQIQS